MDSASQTKRNVCPYFGCRGERCVFRAPILAASEDPVLAELRAVRATLDEITECPACGSPFVLIEEDG